MPDAERLFTDNWRRTEVALKRSYDLNVVKEILKDCNVEIEATGFAIHLMEPRHSKMDGVLKACQILNIDISEVVAIGDSDNDVKMLSQCGYGIAVGNASAPAREAADYVSKAPPCPRCCGRIDTSRHARRSSNGQGAVSRSGPGERNLILSKWRFGKFYRPLCTNDTSWT